MTNNSETIRMAEFHSADFWTTKLERMLQEQRPEDLHLDYKRKESLLLRGRRNRQERGEDISKDVSSFLNSDGGVLVYGVPETVDPDVTGGAPVPGGKDIGFERGEIDKEAIENLITSHVRPRPGPDLFQVSEVIYGDEGRIVFIVEVGVGIGDVWQAADKRYYKRFHFKAEPMEHYEINMARNRNVGPDLELVFGVNDRWEPRLSGHGIYEHRNKEIQVHIGVQNGANAVAESALIELGVCPYTNDPMMRRIYNGEFPEDLFPTSFARIGIRRAKWASPRGLPDLDGVNVAWGQLFWNGSNSALAGRYAPIFKTQTPLPVAVVPMKGVYHLHQFPQIAFCVWRVQAPNMVPRKGVVEVRSSGISRDPHNPLAFVDVYEKDWEIT